MNENTRRLLVPEADVVGESSGELEREREVSFLSRTSHGEDDTGSAPGHADGVFGEADEEQQDSDSESELPLPFFRVNPSLIGVTPYMWVQRGKQEAYMQLLSKKVENAQQGMEKTKSKASGFSQLADAVRLRMKDVHTYEPNARSNDARVSFRTDVP